MTVALDLDPALLPLDFSDEAHARHEYVDPTDPQARPLRGSTDVIKKAVPPYLVPWAAKVSATYAVDNVSTWSDLDRQAAIDLIKGSPDRERDHAADKGTVVHRFMELHAAGRLDLDEIWQPEAVPYIRAGLRFLDEWRPVFVWHEATVFSPDLGYAGTLDFIAELPGLGLVIGDYKTSKGIYPEVALQLASYRYADHAVAASGRRLDVPEVEGAVVVHLRPDETYEVRPVRAGEDAFEAFRAGLGICEWKATTRGVIGPAVWPPQGVGEGVADEPPFLMASSDAQVEAPSPTSSSTPTSAPSVAATTVDPALAPTTAADAAEDDEPSSAASVSRVDWIRGRVQALIDFAPTVDIVDVTGYRTPAEVVLAWWPDGILTPAESETFTDAEVDLISERLSMVEAALEAPFGDPDPADARIAADDPRVLDLADRAGVLPVDLRTRLDAFAADRKLPRLTGGRATEPDLAAVVGEVEAIEVDYVARLDRIAELVNETMTVVDDDDVEAVSAKLALIASSLRVARPSQLTAIEAVVLGHVVEALTTSYLTPELEPAENAGALIESLHGGKRQAVASTKAAAKACNVTPPTKFADLVADPVLVSLAVASLGNF